MITIVLRIDNMYKFILYTISALNLNFHHQTSVYCFKFYHNISYLIINKLVTANILDTHEKFIWRAAISNHISGGREKVPKVFNIS